MKIINYLKRISAIERFLSTAETMEKFVNAKVAVTKQKKKMAAAAAAVAAAAAKDNVQPVAIEGAVDDKGLLRKNKVFRGDFLRVFNRICQTKENMKYVLYHCSIFKTLNEKMLPV